MRALIGLALVPACTLYGGDPVDDVIADDVPYYPDAWREQIDAAPLPDCASPLPCPIPQPGRISLCGRVQDVATGAVLGAEARSCDGSTLTGACQLWVRFYDALDYTGNPTGAVPLIPAALRYDGCGRFAAESLPRPSLGFVAIVTDDAPGAADDHRPTMSAMPVTSGQVVAEKPIFSLRRVTDEAWAAQASLAGMTFADRGAILGLFTLGDAPVAGVTITSNGSIRAQDDSYFGDGDPATRATVEPTLGVTGVDGAALMLNSPLVEHSGSGSEPSGCVWTSDLAASVLGVLFVQSFHLETPGGAPCAP